MKTWGSLLCVDPPRRTTYHQPACDTHSNQSLGLQMSRDMPIYGRLKLHSKINQSSHGSRQGSVRPPPHGSALQGPLKVTQEFARSPQGSRKVPQGPLKAPRGFTWLARPLLPRVARGLCVRMVTRGSAKSPSRFHKVPQGSTRIPYREFSMLQIRIVL